MFWIVRFTVAEVPACPAARSLLAHAMAMPILNNIGVRANGIVHSDQIGLTTVERTVRNVSEVLGEGGEVVIGIGAIRNVVARSNRAADDPLVVVEVVTGTGIARIIRKGSRRKNFKGIRNEDLELGGIVDGASLVDVPVGVGTSRNGLRLDGSGVESLHRDFAGHHVQKVVGLDRDSDWVVGTIRVGVA